jgi:hypothetical protein
VHAVHAVTVLLLGFSLCVLCQHSAMVQPAWHVQVCSLGVTESVNTQHTYAVKPLVNKGKPP